MTEWLRLCNLPVSLSYVSQSTINSVRAAREVTAALYFINFYTFRPSLYTVYRVANKNCTIRPFLVYFQNVSPINEISLLINELSSQ